MRIACCTFKATNSLSQDMEYLLLFRCTNAAFNVLLYVRCLSGLFSTFTFSVINFLTRAWYRACCVWKQFQGNIANVFYIKVCPRVLWLFKISLELGTGVSYVFHIHVWHWIPLPWNILQIKLCQVHNDYYEYDSHSSFLKASSHVRSPASIIRRAHCCYFLHGIRMARKQNFQMECYLSWQKIGSCACPILSYFLVKI